MAHDRHTAGSFWASFGYAAHGLWWAYRHERNLRVHTVLGALAVALGLLEGLGSTKFLVLAVLIILVVALELVNTAIEALTDLAHPGFSPLAGVAKDLAAAVSVLLTDNLTIAGLNAEWRGREGPTDVLSFSQREGEAADPEDPVLGDIVISIERALAQAETGEHVRLARITEQIEIDADALAYLDENRLVPGRHAFVAARAPDGTVMLELDVEGEPRTVAVGAVMSRQLYVTTG